VTDKTRAPVPPGPIAELPRADDAARKRRAEGRVQTVAGAALVLAIVGMTNYLSFRHFQRWDWTSQGVFTLSERSRQVLRELGTDVEIHVVMSSAEGNYQELRELLERYRAVTQRIRLDFVDPDREAAEYRVLAERFGIGSSQSTDGTVGADVALVMVAGDRTWKVTRDDLVSVDMESLQEGESRLDVRSEQAVTGGILEVTSGRRTKVCLTQGHGEWTLDRGAQRDLGGLQDEMRRENLELEAFETRGLSAVPEGCDAVFAVGPTVAFTADEAALLQRYVRGGGNLLVTLDPEIQRDEIPASGLEEVLRDFGIRVDRSIVLELDPRFLPQGATNPAGPFLVATWGDHPVTRGFRQVPGLGMVTELTRSIRPIDPERATTLFSASESSFAETDIARLVAEGEPTRDDADLAGPVSIGVATRVEAVGEAPEGEGEPSEDREGGRVVVVGDSDFLDARYLATGEVVNFDVASALVGWLTERAALIELPSRRISAQPVRMTQDDVTGLFFRVVVLLPLAVTFLGFAVWWNRRS